MIKIIHVEGSRVGQSQDLPGPVVTMGRDPSCNVAFDPNKDDKVSSRHAQLSLQGSNLIIMDQGSKNGTFVNGQRVGQPMLVPPNAVIQLGEGGPKIMVQVTAAAPAPTPAPAPPPAAPAAAPASGGSNKPLLIGCCLVFLVLLCVGGGIAAWLGMKPTEESKDAKPSNGKTDAKDDKKDDAKPEKKDERKAKDTCWAKLPIGAVIEVKTSSQNKGTGASQSTTKYTLKERDDKRALVEVESSMNVPGIAPVVTSKEEEYPLVELEKPAPPADPKQPKPTITKETIEVKGFGKVECDKIVVKETLMGVQKSLSQSWIDPTNSLPNPIKTSYETPVMSSKVEIAGVKLPGGAPK